MTAATDSPSYRPESTDVDEPREDEQTPPRRGRPRLDPPGRRDKALAQMLLQIRREKRISVRVLLERMQQPMSAPTYARYETGQRTLTRETLQDICRALEINADELAVRADAQIAATNMSDDIGFVLDPSGPQVPAIRVRVSVLMSADQEWLTPVRGMLRLHANGDTDDNGDLLLDEPLIRAIAQILGISLLDCWARLSGFIQHD